MDRYLKKNIIHLAIIDMLIEHFHPRVVKTQYPSRWVAYLSSLELNLGGTQ